ncbi:hypothetical protein O9G_001431 [Rozella allomycis CSF55]|uniref:Uncharacterized protein n=1 Tax=Rozella allomycis (strain CSF55) TaxID=988480 RepID=A0A075B5D2_ROZAC|nr:hypothetical protein O9G_001431 [Rozella allomycis CSF55]|eukprot:EPZ36986.1 hypothetical protein O9G_001431 [Rozella allomycis CSF55]
MATTTNMNIIEYENYVIELRQLSMLWCTTSHVSVTVVVSRGRVDVSISVSVLTLDSVVGANVSVTANVSKIVSVCVIVSVMVFLLHRHFPSMSRTDGAARIKKGLLISYFNKYSVLGIDVYNKSSVNRNDLVSVYTFVVNNTLHCAKGSFLRI